MNARIDHRMQATAGLSPGALVHVGERRVDRPKLTVFEYDERFFSERELAELKDPAALARAAAESDTVLWINVDGVHEAAFIDDLGRHFGLHPLLLEDVMNASQRPKVEDYDDCYFLVLKMLDVEHERQSVVVEQVSLVIGRGFVITFQERDGDVFDGVRERLRTGRGKIRRMGADYLAYALVDAIVDHYFVAVDQMNELVEDLETRLHDEKSVVEPTEIYTLKREVLFLRRTVAPVREVLGELVRQETASEIISDAVDIYFRDVFDHAIQVNESLDTLREMLVSLLEMYHSIQGSRLNEVMRILTVISTIFMPLTFIAGIYGMNFDNMPELHAPWGYAACLVVMVVVGLGMTLYMRRKKWL